MEIRPFTWNEDNSEELWDRRHLFHIMSPSVRSNVNDLPNGTFNMEGGNITGNTADQVRCGIDIFDNGTFNLSGSSVINVDNDVFLNNSKEITVTGILDPGSGVKNIRPADTSGTIVTYSGVSIPDDWETNFVLNSSWAATNPNQILGISENHLLLGTRSNVTYYNDTAVYLTVNTVSNAKLTKPTDPFRQGYAVYGWNNTSTGPQWDFTTDTIHGDTDLYVI